MLIVSSWRHPSATPATRSMSPSGLGSTPDTALSGTATGTPTARNTSTVSTQHHRRGPPQQRGRHRDQRARRPAPTAKRMMKRGDSYTGQKAQAATPIVAHTASVLTMM